MVITGHTMSHETKEELKRTHSNRGRGGKATGHLSEDLKHYFVVDDDTDETVIKVSFYGDKQMTPETKVKIGKEMVRQYLLNMGEQREKEEAESIDKINFQKRCRAFKDAYRLQDRHNKTTIVWLLTEIVNMTQEEAERRYDIVTELLNIPEFQEKESDLVDKIYLNPYFKENENSKHKYVQYFGG